MALTANAVDVYEMRWIGCISGHTNFIIRNYYRLEGSDVPGATPEKIFTQPRDALLTAVLPLWSDKIEFTRYEMRQIHSMETYMSGDPPTAKWRVVLTGYEYSIADPATDKGAITAPGNELAPSFVSVNIVKKTDAVGRGGQGNWRLIPPLDSHEQDGELTAAGVADWTTVATALSAGVVIEVGTCDAIPVLFRKDVYLSKQDPNRTPVTDAYDIVLGLVNPRLRSLDSRKRPSFGCE